MTSKAEKFEKKHKRENLPDVRPGDKIRIRKKIKGEDKTQTIEGIVIAKKHGNSINSTITVMQEVAKVGVERILPLHSPSIKSIEVIERAKVRKAKLNYLKERTGKKKKLKKKGAKK